MSILVNVLTPEERKIDRIKTWLKKQNNSNIVGFKIQQTDPIEGLQEGSAEWLNLEQEDGIVLIYDNNDMEMFEEECIVFLLNSLDVLNTHIGKNKVTIELIGDTKVTIEPILIDELV